MCESANKSCSILRKRLTIPNSFFCLRFRAYFCPGCIDVPQIQGVFMPGVHRHVPDFGQTLPRWGMTYRRMNAFKHSLLLVTHMAKGAKEGVFDKLKNIGSEIKGILEGILGIF